MSKTRIIVQHRSSYPLYIRGEGVRPFNWNYGVPLTQVSSDEWLWETDEFFQFGKFKVLINDEMVELGESHPLYPGTSMRINPKFPLDK